jgi:hypothetical protein
MKLTIGAVSFDTIQFVSGSGSRFVSSELRWEKNDIQPVFVPFLF